jgi:flagellar L-ring protein precursor FlgH
MMNKRLYPALLVALLAVSSAPATADSLFSDATYEGLTSDLSARRVGDALTVLIYEDASAAASANAQTQRSAELDAQMRDSNDSVSGGLGFSNEFEGDGEISRSGKLVARVSVTVDKVSQNGDLHVTGAQEIRFNQETQSIKLSGWVRPEDLSPANTVLSTRLANASIEYTGEGLLGNSERPGWLTRFLRRIF